jgi:hypothetical protein
LRTKASFLTFSGREYKFRYPVFLVLFVLVLPNAAIAVPNYSCTITNLLSQSFPIEKSSTTNETESNLSDGYTSIFTDWMKSVGQTKADHTAKLYVGKRFWIDTETGRVTGDISSESLATHEVLSRGDEEWPFRLLIQGHSLAGGQRHIMYVEVQQYSTSLQKPFVGVGMTVGSSIVVGNCILT